MRAETSIRPGDPLESLIISLRLCWRRAEHDRTRDFASMLRDALVELGVAVGSVDRLVQYKATPSADLVRQLAADAAAVPRRGEATG